MTGKWTKVKGRRLEGPFIPRGWGLALLTVLPYGWMAVLHPGKLEELVEFRESECPQRYLAAQVRL